MVGRGLICCGRGCCRCTRQPEKRPQCCPSRRLLLIHQIVGSSVILYQSDLASVYQWESPDLYHPGSPAVDHAAVGNPTGLLWFWVAAPDLPPAPSYRAGGHHGATLYATHPRHHLPTVPRPIRARRRTRSGTLPRDGAPLPRTGAGERLSGPPDAPAGRSPIAGGVWPPSAATGSNLHGRTLPDPGRRMVGSRGRDARHAPPCGGTPRLHRQLRLG